MTIATAPKSTLPGKIASALLGIAIGASSMAAISTPAPSVCHVPANPGTYTCTVTVDALAPSPSPSVAPTPAPTPSPTPAPTPTPMVGVAVPVTIDATGASDVSTKLASFLNGLPANTTVQFPPGAIYSVATAIKLGGRTNLDLEGNGATLRATGTGTNENYSVLYFQTFPGSNTGVSVHNFKIAGDDPSPNTFVGGKEGAMGILVDGGNGFDIAGNTFSSSWGDAVEVNSAATNVRIHNNTILSAGRNALSVIWGNHVEMDHNQITQVGYVTFDIEPNTASEPSSFVSIHDNAGGKWSDAFFAVDGSSTGAAISDLSVVNNTSTTGLLAIINPSGKAREPRVTFTGNTGPATSGPVVTAHAVDGLTVTGNTPAKSGSFLSAVSCTGVVGQ